MSTASGMSAALNNSQHRHSSLLLGSSGGLGNSDVGSGSGNDLTNLTTSQQQQQPLMQLTQQHFQTRRHSRTPSFLLSSPIHEENTNEMSGGGGGGGLSSSNESKTMDQQQQRQQQQQEEDGNTNVGGGIINDSYLGSDPLDRRFGYNPLRTSTSSAVHGQKYDNWFPDPNQPLLAAANHHQQRRRESKSSGSSGTTAITGNTTLESNMQKQQQQQLQQQHQPSKLPSAVPENRPSMDTTPTTANMTESQQQQQGERECSGCDRCAQMESTLLTLQADLEYLRTLELQREFDGESSNNNNNGGGVPSSDLNNNNNKLPLINNNRAGQQSVSSANMCIGSRGSRTSSRLYRRRPSSSGGGKTTTDGGSIVSGTSRSRTTRTQRTNFASQTSMFLRDASKRLSDLSTRHKRQVKQTTHERAYWQNDIHLKLEKFALMCKNLNEEAAHRSNEVKETKVLLDKMTNERNTLASQIDTLKARVELYQGENVEQSRLRQEWEQERLRLLNSLDQTMKERDAMVNDLTTRLELAAETIENERKQHTMRRQIIFPTNNTKSTLRHSSSSKLSDAGGGGGDNVSSPPSPNPKVDNYTIEQMQKTKEMATKAQMSLEAALLQSATREKAMQLRMEALELELADARRKVTIDGKVQVPLNDGEGGVMSIRRTNSSTSCSGTL